MRKPTAEMTFDEWFRKIVAGLRRAGFKTDEEIREGLTAIAELSRLTTKHLKEGEKLRDLDLKSRKGQRELDEWSGKAEKKHRKIDVRKWRRTLSGVAELVRREGVTEDRIVRILRDSLNAKKAAP